jgi:serine/threonine protein phosphatase PrpC
MPEAAHLYKLLGTKHRTPDTFHLEDIDANRAMGTTPGNAISIAKKRDDNEDAVAWLPADENGGLAILADAHFGAESGDIAIDYLHHHFSHAAPYPLRQMFRLHLEIDDEIRSLQHLQGRFRMTSATTLVTCVFSGNQAQYCSTGDSPILRVRNGKLETLSPSRPIFLGDPEPLSRQLVLALQKEFPTIAKVIEEQPAHTLFQLTCQLRDYPLESITFDPVLLESLKPDYRTNLLAWVDRHMPHFGTFDVQSGDILMLASDGISPDASALEVSDIEALLKTPPATAVQTAEALLKATIGDDNLTLFIYQPSPIGAGSP